MKDMASKKNKKPASYVSVIHNELKAIPRVGAFAVGGSVLLKRLPSLVHLIVQGVDAPINLPLRRDPSTLQLLSIAKQAPFGKGKDTVVDTSVRRAW